MKSEQLICTCRGTNSTIFHSSLFGLFCVGHVFRIGLNIYEVIQVGECQYEASQRVRYLQVVTTGSPQTNNISLVDLSHFLLLFNSSFNVCLIALMVRRNFDT